MDKNNASPGVAKYYGGLPAGSTLWVWEVSVKRDFEENMVWDHTSFHGCCYSEEWEEEYDEENTFGRNESKKLL